MKDNINITKINWQDWPININTIKFEHGTHGPSKKYTRKGTIKELLQTYRINDINDEQMVTQILRHLNNYFENKK